MHTFVIPAFGESIFLEQCIQSLINQTVKSAVIITTSTPSTYLSQVAEKYSLDYYINNEKGIASDWNFGLSKVKTSLATIAHQDDIYEPSYTECIIKAFDNKKNPPVLLVFTDYYDLVNDKRVGTSLNSIIKKVMLWPFIIKNSINSIFLKKLSLSFGDPICCPSVTLNLESISDFRFSPVYSCVLDWYAWYQLAAQKGAFGFVNRKLLIHRIHLESETTNQLSKGIRGQEELAMFKMIWGNRMGNIWSHLYATGHLHNNAPLKRS